MFWIALIVLVGGGALIKLGAALMLVSILTNALLVGAAGIVAVVVLATWFTLRRSR